MFTLGNKEAIVNAPGLWPVDIATADLLKVRGFGNFATNQIVSAFAQRYTPKVQGSISVVAPTAAAMGIGAGEASVAVKFHLRIDDTRDDAEWSIGFIRKGRPMIVEFLVDGGATAEQVATALEDALVEWGWKFTMGKLPFSVSRTTDTLTLTMTAGDGNLDFQLRTTFLASGMGVDRTSFEKVVTATRITKGSEPINGGKFLEENTAMGLHANDGNYAIGGPNNGPDVNAGYTSITFVAKATEAAGVDGLWAPHAHLSTVAADAEVGQRNVTFTLYFKEGTDLMIADADIITGGDTRGDVQKVVDFLIAGAPTIATFYKADGTAATTVADFMA